MNMNKNNIPDCKLEWYILGTLPKHELEEIAALEQSDATIRARIEALRADDAQIWADNPQSRLAERLAQRRSSSLPHRQRKGKRWPLSFFICAALMLILPMLIIVGPAFIETLEDDGVHTEDKTVIEAIEGDSINAKDEIDSVQTLISD